MATVKLSTLKEDSTNPRQISAAEFDKLKASLSEFPKMMELRPIIIDEDNKILAGRQRRAALLDLGYKEIPTNWVKKAKELTPDEKRRFMLLDNYHAGDWDYAILAKDWNLDLATNWGISLSFPKTDTTISFTAKTKAKGTQVRIQCKDSAEAGQLATELIARGMDVEIK